MAITTLAGVIAGNQPPVWFTKTMGVTGSTGRTYSLWGGTGFPGAGSFDTTLAGANLSSSSTIPAGALPHYDPGSGSAYVSRLQAVASGTAGMLMLCDRLWHNQLTINSSGAQTINSAAWPARDNNGSANGEGVYLAIEVSATVSATTPTVAVTYTNSAGTASRSGSFADGTGFSAAVAGTWHRILVQQGDIGIRSVQSATFTTPWTTGTVNMVAYRVLAAMELISSGTANAIDALIGGLPILYNGVVPFFAFQQALGANSIVSGTYIETQG